MAFSMSDIEKINKLSGILVIPFLVAALYTQFGWWAVSYDESILRFIESSNRFVSLSASVFAFIVSVFIVLIAYFVVEAITATWNVLRITIALTFLSYGVLGLGSGFEGLSALISNGESLKYNLYFNFAALAWGFEIFRIEEAKANKNIKTDNSQER